MIYELLTTSRF